MMVQRPRETALVMELTLRHELHALMIVAVFVLAPVGLPAWYWLVLSRVLAMPLGAGLSFELIKATGRAHARGLAGLGRPAGPGDGPRGRAGA